MYRLFEYNMGLTLNYIFINIEERSRDGRIFPDPRSVCPTANRRS